MIPEKVFHQILVLGEAWRVASVDYVEPERRLLIRVEETLGLWAEQGCRKIPTQTAAEPT